MPAADGGPALFRLVRFWSRRWSTGSPTAADRHVRHVLVMTAVDAAGSTATIAAVAHQLGLDRSGASRLVRDAASEGLLTRRAGDDRRQASVVLTGAGRTLLDAALAWQRTAFAELTKDWPEADRNSFATYLHRLADETTA